jgi:hypothetical protein
MFNLYCFVCSGAIRSYMNICFICVLSFSMCDQVVTTFHYKCTHFNVPDWKNKQIKDPLGPPRGFFFGGGGVIFFIFLVFCVALCFLFC